MITGAVITTIIMSGIFIAGFIWCFSQIGKGGKWED